MSSDPETGAPAITSTGRALTEAEIDELAAEAEQGYPVITQYADGKFACEQCTLYPLGSAYVTSTVDDMQTHIQRHREAALPVLTDAHWQSSIQPETGK